MSTKLSRQPGIGQETMFDIAPPEITLTLASPEADSDQADLDDQTGASVLIAQRAIELGLTLKALNAASSRAGFQAAVTTPHRTKIENRYGRHTNVVVEGASHNEDVRLREARQHFNQAAGKTSLIAAGVSREVASQSTNELFRSFTARYGVGRTTGEVRNKMAKQIQRSSDIITGKKKR